MSADDTTKSKPPAPVVKDAEVVSTPRDDRPTGPRPITIGQHLFIWSMILLVGVIFGVGSSFTFLQQGAQEINGVSETEVILRRHVAENLQSSLAGSDESFVPRNDGYRERIRLARLAAAEGLKPAGADLDRVVEEFLERTVSAPGGGAGRTYRELLTEHRGTKTEVTVPELRMFLADQAAIDALFARHLVLPAIPTTVADDLERMRLLTISADQVVLDATHLLQPVAADDPELQTTYEKLRAARFTQRAQVTVTVASADLAALAAKATVTDAEVQAYYDAHKDSYRKPAAPVVPPATAPAVEYKPLTEVAAEIRTTLARTAAVTAGAKLVEDFNHVVEDKDLETADAAAFAAAATAAGLKLSGALTIEEPAAGAQIDLGAFGRIADPAGIFIKDPGFITSPLQSGTPDKEWFVLRISGHAPAGYKQLDAVRAEMQQIVAGNRAYKKLLEQAEALRAAADKAGPGGLKKIMADPANAAWKATPTVSDLYPLTELHAPPSEVGGIAGEPRLAISLTMPERPVVLVSADGQADVPQVKLVQVGAVTRKTGQAPGMEPGQAAGAYRQELGSYRQTQFSRELTDQLGR